MARFAVTETPSGLPLFQRVAESVAEAIRRGRVRPGERLPSSRALARDLDVHRNTVLAAYEELERQGYLETRPARGTFAASNLPKHPKRPAQQERRPVRFSLPRPPETRASDTVPQGVIALVPGLPDLRELPTDRLARAYRAALKAAPNTLDYQSMYGHPRLLGALSDFLRDARGVVVEPGGILATRGSQQALYLAARALIKPGSVIAVEQYGYQPAWQAFHLAGATLTPVPVDRHGLVVSKLKPLAARGNLAAVYVTPHHQYPTTVTMSAARRMELLELARARRFCILEDDYDHEFHFSGRPVLPLASADTSGVVVHVGSLSKVLAPGLRAGFAVGQAPIIESMALHRRYLDRQGDHATELALSYLIEDGELGAHIRRMHRAYAERRDVLHQSLREELSGALSFRVPSGGIALWARVTCSVKPEHWCDAALEQGVLIQPGRHYRFDGAAAPFVRFGYARHNPREIKDGVRRLARALESIVA